MKRQFVCSFISFLAVLITACAQTPATETAPAQVYNPVIDPANFVAAVDNPYFPLVPGTKFIYERQTTEGLERVEVVVMQETKEILGVRATVVQDTVWLNGELLEDTTDWYAQDKDGNVWYFGEDTKEYTNGSVSSTAGTWTGGVDGALPGILIPADPQVGVEYRQEYYPGKAEDFGKVVSLGEAVSVPFGSFTDCLKTEDWTPLEPNVLENKVYCPGIGLVQTISVKPVEPSEDLIAVETQ